MKGLLLKDFYTLLRQAKIFLMLIVLFSLLPNMQMSAFAVVYASMLPITALAYDERAKWDSLAAMMPYSERDIVLSKYLLGYILIAGSAVIASLCQTVIGMVKREPATSEQLISILLVACVATILLAVNLPFMFKMGVERGRVVFFILVAVTTFAGMTLGSYFLDALTSARINPALAAIVFIALTVVVNAASIAISARVYKNKTA